MYWGFRTVFGAERKKPFPQVPWKIPRTEREKRPQISNFPDEITNASILCFFFVSRLICVADNYGSVYAAFDAWYVFHVKFKLWTFSVFIHTIKLTRLVRSQSCDLQHNLKSCMSTLICMPSCNFIAPHEQYILHSVTYSVWYHMNETVSLKELKLMYFFGLKNFHSHS